jgi:hypothetical protein
MVGPALLQLLHDLEHTPDRSDYEEALLGEVKPLIALAERFEPIERAIQVSLAAGGEEVHSTVNLRRTLVSRIASTFALDRDAVRVGIGGLPALGTDFAKRQCSKRDCPLKRL